MSQQPIELFSPGAEEQTRGLKLAEAATMEGPLCAAVLAVAHFSEHADVRAKARALVLSHGPAPVRAVLEADKRNSSALQDGAKLAKFAATYAPAVEPRAFSLAILRVFTARASSAPAWAGAAIEGALHAALTHANGSEVFEVIRGIDRIDLTIKKELPAGLHRLRDVKWLRVTGPIKSEKNVAELAQLPAPIGLILTGKDLDLEVLLPAAENIDGLAFHGNASKLTDISLLSRFSKLATLWLAGTGVKDLSPLAALPLVELTLGPVESIEPLRGKLTLTRLTAERQRCDLAPLASLTNLTSLNLSFGLIKSAEYLAPLTRLTHLNLSGTGVRDLSPLAGKPLKELFADAPSSLEPLFGMTTLEKLTLRGAEVGAQLDELERRIPGLQVTSS